MPDKITVIQTVDVEDRVQYMVSAPTLADLAMIFGVSEDRFAVTVDPIPIRHQRLQELNRRMNTPEALRQRDIDPWTGRPVSF
jgi:hypothetical protein